MHHQTYPRILRYSAYQASSDMLRLLLSGMQTINPAVNTGLQWNHSLSEVHQYLTVWFLPVPLWHPIVLLMHPVALQSLRYSACTGTAFLISDCRSAELPDLPVLSEVP